ncbi:MAG: hypothetical protein ABIA76_02865 [Candidatus Diapherotrites archaeon]
MKRIVMDSSTIICLSEKCLTPILSNFVQKNNIELIVPSSVYRESVKKPMQIRRFELNALRIKKLVDEGLIKLAPPDGETEERKNEILELANNVFWAGNHPFRLLHEGEAEMLALLKQFKTSFAAVDERTARMIIESPKRLKQILEKRNNQSFSVDKDSLDKLNDVIGKANFVRSAELMVMAFRQGLFCSDLSEEFESLKATLYALKFAGCAISSEEIDSLTERDLK